MHRQTCIQFKTDFSSYSNYIGISHLTYFSGTMRMILHCDILQSNWISHSVYTEPPISMGTSIIYVLGGTRARPDISEGPRYEGSFLPLNLPGPIMEVPYRSIVVYVHYMYMSLIIKNIDFRRFGRRQISVIKNHPQDIHISSTISNRQCRRAEKYLFTFGDYLNVYSTTHLMYCNINKFTCFFHAYISWKITVSYMHAT